MKLLETEFVQNSDKRGDNKFVQIKRNEHAAIYRRFDMNGLPLEYEVFQVKAAGGNEIFGRYYEEYEQYPGAAAFGKTAWSCVSLETAERIFLDITTGEGSRKGGSKITHPKAVKIRVAAPRGRRRVKRPEIVFPKTDFNMKNLVKLNTIGWTKPMLYLAVTNLVKEKKAVITRRKKGNRGKPTTFYKIVAG